MSIAKKIISCNIVCILLMHFGWSLKAQTISGSYLFDNKVSSTTLIFNSNTFQEKTMKDGYTWIGEGSYEVRDKKLILAYTKALNKDSSAYVLTFTDKFSNEYSGVIALNVVAEGNPCQATITFLDSLNHPISGFQTDKQGDATAYIYPATAAKTMTISAVAFETVVIPVSRFTRKISDLKVNMKMQSKNIYKSAATVEYRLVKQSKDELLLQSPDNIQQLFKRSR